MKSKFTWSLIGLSLFFGMVGCSSSKQETTEIPVITIDPGKQMTAEEITLRTIGWSSCAEPCWAGSTGLSTGVTVS